MSIPRNLSILAENASSTGVLSISGGGTNTTSFTANQIHYGSFSQSAGLTFDGTNFATTGTATAAKLIPTGTSVTGNGLYLPAANALGLSTNGTNAVYIDSSQNVGIGTISPATRLSVVSGTNAGISVNDGTVNTIIYNSTGGVASIGTTTNHPVDFYSNNAARMRIESSGNLLVGTTSASGLLTANQTANSAWAGYFVTTPASGVVYGIRTQFSGYTPNNTTSFFLFGGDTTGTKFAMYANGGLANFSANNVNLSDRREKTNFAPAGSYLTKICAIPVQTFNYIDQNLEEDDGLTLGVVAQDVQAIAPELVTESNWGTPEEPKMRLSIYQTDLQYALMKSIQEQQALITSLTARIEALEAK